MNTPYAPFRLFIGTYTRAGGKGIYTLELDPHSGSFSTPRVAAETSNPSYLALSPDHSTLYAVSEAEAMAAAFRVNRTTGGLMALPGSQQAGGKAPCHLSVDTTGRVLLVANYHTGVVASLPILTGGALGPAASVIQHHGSSIDAERQSSPHVHSVTLSPDNRFVLVCDLGLDKIFSYRLDLATATLDPAEIPFIPTPPGSGPRHLAFAPSGQHAFVITEMGATLLAYGYDADRGTLQQVDAQSTLGNETLQENKSAAVRVHQNGRYVYASNRGPDTIAVFTFDDRTEQLTPVEQVSSGGNSPRDFALSPDGRWLVAAHQDSDLLTLFQVSSQTGRLTPLPARAEISMPVCVLFAG